MLRTRTSLAANGSGSRTVNVTWARGKSVGVGPLGRLVLDGLRVGNVGHLSSEMAQAWLPRARTRMNKRIRREKTECEFMVSPQYFTQRCSLTCSAWHRTPGSMRYRCRQAQDKPNPIIRMFPGLICFVFARRRRYNSGQY